MKHPNSDTSLPVRKKKGKEADLKKVVKKRIEGGEIFFHQVLDIFFLMEYLLIFREKPEMFKWKETELAERNGEGRRGQVRISGLEKK